MINHKLEWTTEEPIKEGFFYALKENHVNKLICVAVFVTDLGGEIGIGATSYTGEEHASYGHPLVRPMAEEFIMWAELPNPFA